MLNPPDQKINKRPDRVLRERIHDDLLKLVDDTLSHPTIGPKIKNLLSIFHVGVDELKQEVLSYTLNKGERGYENDRYRKKVARLTLHFHNLVEGTYHQERHRLVASFLEQAMPKHFLDIGYGVPGAYLFSYLRKNLEATVGLLDQDPTAEEFARIVIENEAPELLSRVRFQIYDMNSELYPGDADAYLYLDSIEHTKRPTEYLHKIVVESRSGNHFIFSLPICNMKGLEGFHFAEWLADGDARKWVEDAGLRVVVDGVAYPNPVVDYFAELNDGGYHNYLVLSRKD